MSLDPSQAAIDCAYAFIRCFNAQDHGALAKTLNYPHVRLANDRFVTVEHADQFASGSARAEVNLRAEGWHHTTVRELQVVHAGADKVHLALAIDRRHEDGTVYSQFDTLWIATCVDGHWGIQFRSSFLRAR